MAKERLIDANKFKADLIAFASASNEDAIDLACVIKMLDTCPVAYDRHRVKELISCASWYTDTTYDEDGYSNDDEEEVINTYQALKLVDLGGIKKET